MYRARQSVALVAVLVMTTLGEGACGGLGGGPYSPIRDFEPPRPPSIEKPSLGCSDHNTEALRKQINKRPPGDENRKVLEKALARCSEN